MSLTKYQEGSFKELSFISFPLMLSSLSVMMMLFVDRLLLANYSSEAMNAAVTTSTFGWSFVLAWMSLTAIAEVFVAQFNGANQKDKLGVPVWQMIWLGISSILFFAPLAIFGSEWIYGTGSDHVLERSFFFWLMVLSPVFPIEAALASFFIGQGKIGLVTFVSIAANIINVILDIILIFGIEGWVPSMGIEGAAIATSAGGVFQCAVLGYVFLNKENRKNHGTGNYQLNWSSFWDCIRVGFPGAVFVAIELLGWAAYYGLMKFSGEEYITVAGICQSVVFLFFFAADGVSKAATTIAGNMIGAGKSNLVPKVFRSGCWLHLLFLIITLGFYLFFSDFIIDEFLVKAPESMKESLKVPLQHGLILILIYLFFEGVRMLLWGLLIAAGDTMFLLIAGTLSVWLFLVMPVYYFMVLNTSPIEMGMITCVSYSIIASFVFFWRFNSEKWKTFALVSRG